MSPDDIVHHHTRLDSAHPGPVHRTPPQPEPAVPESAAPASTLIPAPAALTFEVEDGMLARAVRPLGQSFVLALAAGALIALGAVFLITSQQGMAGVPIGAAKVLGGVVFAVGLVLVVICGADLFTGSTMTVMPLLSRRLGIGRLLIHWAVSLVGNAIGAVGVAVLVLLAGTPWTNGGAWGLAAMNTALTKSQLGWGQAFCLGILANVAVCLAIWSGTSGRSTADKVLGITGPVALFVSTGFEHSVANLFLLPMGLLVRHGAPDSFWTSQAVRAAGRSPADYSSLTLAGAGHNLVPVVLGNIVGGAVLVGGWFWLAFRRPELRSTPTSRVG